MTCSLCDKPAHGRGWCRMHYYRWWKHGDPNAAIKSRGVRPGYTAVHNRLKASRGKAADYPCVDCGQPAREWSYKSGGGGKPFTDNLDEYEPRCVSCHRKLDYPTPELCLTKGCNSAHLARGMCKRHYQRWHYQRRVANRNTTT